MTRVRMAVQLPMAARSFIWSEEEFRLLVPFHRQKVGCSGNKYIVMCLIYYLQHFLTFLLLLPFLFDQIQVFQSCLGYTIMSVWNCMCVCTSVYKNKKRVFCRVGLMGLVEKSCQIWLLIAICGCEERKWKRVWNF